MDPVQSAGFTAKQPETEIQTAPSFFQRWGRHIHTASSKAATVAKVALVVGAIIGLALFFTPALAAATPMLQGRNIQSTELTTSTTSLQGSSYRSIPSAAPHLRSGSILHAIPEVSQVQTRLALKRAAAQSSILSFSPATPLFPTALGTPTTKATLCISGIEGVWRDGNRTLLFLSDGTAIQRLQTESETITSQLQTQAALDSIDSSCGEGYYHFLTREGGTDVHSSIGNQAVTTAPYTLPSGMQGPSIAKLLNNQAVMTWLNGTEYYYARTDGSGRFPASGTFLRNALTVEPTHPGAISFSDGSFRFLSSGTVNGLFEAIFDALGTFVSGGDINNRQSLSQIILPRTPIPADADFIPILSPGQNGTAPTIYTYDNRTKTIVSSRVLGSEPTDIPKPAVELCGPHAVTLRTSFDQTLQQYVMKVDMVDPAANCSSVIGGEQVVPVPPASNPIHAQVACFADGMTVITFPDDATGEPLHLTIRRVEATPTTVPSPIDSPAIPPAVPPSSSPSSTSPSIAELPNAEIDVSQIGLNFIPLSSVLTVSNGTAYITLKDTNGFDIVYSINCSQVPVGTEFTPITISGLEIARGNATESNIPEFDVCKEDRTTCSVTVRKTSLQQAADISDSGLPSWVIALIVLAAITPVAGGAAFFYFRKGGIKEVQQQRREKNKDAAERDERFKHIQEAKMEAQMREYERTAPERAVQIELSRAQSQARYWEKLNRQAIKDQKIPPPTDVVVDT